MNFFIERWKKIRMIRKLQAGVFVIVAIILVVVISQRLGTFAEGNTVSNVVTFKYDEEGQTKTVLSNTVYTEITTSPTPTATATATPAVIPMATPSAKITSTAPPTTTSIVVPTSTVTPTPTATVITGGRSEGSKISNFKKTLTTKLAAAKTALIKAKLALIMKLKGKQSKLGAPTINYVTVTPNPAKIGEPIKFEVGWTDPGDQVKIYICKANLLFGRACAKANWCEYGPSPNSPTWCWYTPQAKDQGFKYFYIFACDAGGKCSLGQAGNFRVTK